MKTGCGASIPTIARPPKRNSAMRSPARRATIRCGTGSFARVTARCAGFSVRSTIERDANGRAIRLVGAHSDVTEQVMAEQALRQSEERFRTLADQLAELNATLAQRVEEKTRERDRIWNVSQDLLLVADREGHLENRQSGLDPDAGLERGGIAEPHVGMAGASRRPRHHARAGHKARRAARPPSGSKAAFATRMAPTAGCHGPACRTRITSMRWRATSPRRRPRPNG